MNPKEKFESQWHEIFAAGTHTAMNGEQAVFSNADIDEIARVYNEQTEHEAPIVIGHPKTDAPAYGWVEKVKSEGGKLFAKFKDTAEEFVDLVSQGRYRKKSIKLYPDKKLVHVGFLGAVPPAVKGLRNAAFASDTGMTYEFSDSNGFTLKRFMRAIRDFLIDNFNQETADRIVSDWDIEMVDTKTEEPTSFSGGNMGKEVELQGQITELSQKLDAANGKIQEFAAQETGLKSQIAALTQQVTDLQKADRRKDAVAFVDGLIAGGKLLPAEKDATLSFMEALSESGEMEFADGVKKSKLDVYKEQLSARPKLLEFSQSATKDKAGQGGSGSALEFAGMNVDQDQLAVHTKALELAESEKIPYRDAVTRVLKQ